MKKSLPLALAALLVACCSYAKADTMTWGVNIENFGTGDPDGSGGATDQLVWSQTFALPDITSFDSITMDLAHNFGSDISVVLFDPNGNSYFLLEGQGSTANGTQFLGTFDGDELGDGGGFLLANTQSYTIVAAGTTGNTWLNNGTPLPSGTYDQRTTASQSWATGPFAAGNWTIELWDAWDSLDEGSIGDFSVNYTTNAIPEPTSALACLSLAGFALIRRRRS